MYRSKAAGEACSTLFDVTMREEAVDFLRVETDLRRGIDAGELELYYQPVIALDTGTVVGFEALMRWRHPVRGLVPPSDFIPVAEETGMIVELGTWALREACRELPRLQAASGRRTWVSVNLSPAQLAQPDLVAVIQRALADTATRAADLRIEITESATIRDLDAAAEALEAQRDLGVRVCMDDFGTGYSSLSRLHRLSFDTLKVDRARSFASSTPPRAAATWSTRS
jgi:EAL domain-containing protein (putative c-di-GMP-specific phosphodiesterase class I)